MLTPSLDPAEYKRILETATDEQLEAALAANREELLRELFMRRMPVHFDPVAARGREGILEWRVLGRPEGGEDVVQAVIRGGRCEVFEGSPHAADVTLTVRPVPLMRMMAGVVKPVRMFTLGRVKVHGDLMLAARAPSFFRFPD